MKLQKLAQKLASKHGYKYSKDSKYIMLSYSDKIKISNYIMFILEMER
jgi:hypothetical protein